jgi:hypothetical protein
MAHGRLRVALLSGLIAALTACGGSSSSSPPPPSNPVATALAFSVQPGAVVAGDVLAPGVEVSVLDQNGALFTTPVPVALTLTGGGTLHGTATAVSVNGHATFADLSIHEAGTGYGLTASSAGLTGAQSAAFPVRAAAPDATASDFVVSATTPVAGDTVTLTATLRDAYANPVPGADVTFEASAGLVANTFVQPVASTTAAGLASGSLSSTRAEAKTLVARANGTALGTHPVVTFVAGAPALAGSSLVASPASVVDDGTPTTLTATVADPYGNPVAGQTVTFDSTGVASIYQPSAVTAADGTTSGAVSALVPGAQTFSAHVGPTLVGTRDVTFTNPPADAGLSTVVASLASVPANALSTSTITVTAIDHLGRPIPGASVSLGAVPAAIVAPASATTGADGVAQLTVASAAVGSVVLTATVTSGGSAVAITQTATVGFTVPLAASIAVTSAGGATIISGLGNTLQLSATVSPAAALQGVTWSTSEPGVATIDGAGLVTSHGVGEATLTATATDGSGVTGKFVLIVPGNGVVFVQQANSQIASQWARATMDPGGVLTIDARYGPSGNAFKYVAGTGYYGTNSNGFVCLPYKVSGDFSISATLTLLSSPKASTTCGVGVGLTTGFLPTDRYAYSFLATGTSSPIVTYPRYVSGATAVSQMGSVTTSYPTVPLAAAPTPPAAITFSAGRTGTNLNFAYDSAGSSGSAGAVYFTDGTTVYGSGPVYPCVSYNNVVAAISSLVIRDGAGNVLFDSATGTLSAYTPASLVLSPTSATLVRGDSTNVTATAIAAGGGTATVTAVAADPSIVDVAVTNGVTSSTLALTGLKAGYTTVTVTNTGDPSAATNTRTLPVVVEDFNASDAAYGSIASRVYPAPGAAAAYEDGELSITFDATPVLSTYGSIDVYNLADGTLVDRIFYANETQTVAGVTMKVDNQLARVSGNTVYFTPHFGRLAYGGQYYVGISNMAITGTLNGAPFTGLSRDRTVATWSFTVRSAPTLGASITVNGTQGATPDFRTVGGALMYLAANPIPGATAVTIDVAAGAYTELVNYRAATPNPNLTITIRGPAGNARGDSCVVQYVNGGNWNAQTGRASFYFAGANLVLENLTLRNNAVRSVHAQAETIYFDSRTGYTFAANNCSFISRQDTVQTSGRSWIYNSYIEGNTDFIWGIADVSLFEGCALRVVNDTAGQTYSIFVARTGTTGAATIGKGYVLVNSTVSVDAGIKAAYGRDATAGNFYDQVTVLNNTFTGGGALLDPGLWVTSTVPLRLGDSTYVGWKQFGNTGLNAETIVPDPLTASTIASGGTEYDTRDHILNRVVTVSGGVPTGYTGATTTWDVSSLANAWGAP